jgi:hypothetical protein
MLIKKEKQKSVATHGYLTSRRKRTLKETRYTSRLKYSPMATHQRRGVAKDVVFWFIGANASIMKKIV